MDDRRIRKNIVLKLLNMDMRDVWVKNRQKLDRGWVGGGRI
jgi:hypothetical protein